MVIFTTTDKINSFPKQKKILHYTALKEQADSNNERFLLEVTAAPPGQTILAECFVVFLAPFQESAWTVPSTLFPNH